MTVSHARTLHRDLLLLIPFTEDVGNYHYGQGHPMKPHRIRMAHNLILNYGLYKRMDVYVSYRKHFTNQCQPRSVSISDRDLRERAGLT